MAAPGEEGDEGQSDGLIGQQNEGAGGGSRVMGEAQQQHQQQMGQYEMKKPCILWPSSNESRQDIFNIFSILYYK